MILSERLELRELTVVDAPFILELLNDGDFHRYIGDRGVRTLADAENYIQQGPAVSYARHGHGLYLVVRREDGARLGICGLIKRDTLPCEDIGYAFLPAWRGQVMPSKPRGRPWQMAANGSASSGWSPSSPRAMSARSGYSPSWG